MDGPSGSPGFFLLQVGPRPRESTAAVDLLKHFGLREKYESLSKKTPPSSLYESGYLKHVIGDIDMRKGEGMELEKIALNPDPNSVPRFDDHHFKPIDMNLLRNAFTFSQSSPATLPESEKGVATFDNLGIQDLKELERKRKKHKDKHKDKHRDKDGEKKRDKEKKREKEKGVGEAEDDKHRHKDKKKKRKREGEEDDDKSKKKEKSSKT